jgi:hypothetical protein
MHRQDFHSFKCVMIPSLHNVHNKRNGAKFQTKEELLPNKFSKVNNIP